MGENPNLVFQSQIHEYCLIPGERKAIQQMIRVSTLVPRHQCVPKTLLQLLLNQLSILSFINCFQ